MILLLAFQHWVSLLKSEIKFVLSDTVVLKNTPTCQRALDLNTAHNHSFKVEMDDEANKFMFTQSERLKNI